MRNTPSRVKIDEPTETGFETNLVSISSQIMIESPLRDFSPPGLFPIITSHF
jgi:hypothetical protein